jgi:rhodanese-related sulfurtransferase
VLIAIVGIGLGLSYNKAMLLAHDDRALTWVARERSTGVLGLATPAAAGDATTPAAGSTAPSTDASAPAASTAPATGTEAKPATTSSTTQSAAHDTTHAQKSSAKKSSAKKSAKAAPASTTAKTTPTSASPAHGPIETSEGGAKAAAPATSAPASGGVSNPAAAAGGAAAANAPAIPDTKEPLEANLAVVKALHDANGAVFLDARSAEEYSAGHIPGAISMPFDDVFKKPELAKFDDKGKPIVTYCDGGDCELSKDLAFSLIDNGHKKVVFFKDGLPGWKSAGNPVNTGSQP